MTQYTPTNQRKFTENLKLYKKKQNGGNLAREEASLRRALSKYNLSHVRQRNGEDWSHFMSRLRNEYRRARDRTTPKRSRDYPVQGASQDAKKAKNTARNTARTPARNNNNAALEVTKHGHRAAGDRNKLGPMSTAEIRQKVKNAGYAYPEHIIGHIHNNSPAALKLARKYVVWPMVHTLKDKRQPWEPRLLDEAEIKNKNHREMLKYLKVFPKNAVPKELKARIEPGGNKRYYATNTLRAILGTDAERQKHSTALRTYHKVNVESGKKLSLPFDNPIRQPLERLKKMNHTTLEAFARKEGYRLNHYDNLNNATKRDALPYVMYDQVHPNAQRRHKLKTANDIRTHLKTHTSQDMNVNATTKTLLRAAKGKKTYNLRSLVVDKMGQDLIAELVKKSGFHRKIKDRNESARRQAKKELVAYLRQQIPGIDTVVKNSQSP
jgi:hypothetical protein